MPSRMIGISKWTEENYELGGRLGAFFEEIQSPLSFVLNADGCREGWIQGELFRHFRPTDPSFNVNCSHASKRIKHDMVCGTPVALVAELKVYGLRGYCDKNLYGGSLAAYQPLPADRRIPVDLDTIIKLEPDRENKSAWRAYWSSYFADVRRLSQIADVPERLMILVLQKAATIDRFGRAILAVQVSQQEHTFDLGQFLVRISEL